MEFKALAMVFGTVFLAELGDKTQLATVMFAARNPSLALWVFAAASLALIAATGIAAFAGSALSQLIEPRYLSYVAGSGFILIGLWTLWQA